MKSSISEVKGKTEKTSRTVRSKTNWIAYRLANCPRFSRIRPEFLRLSWSPGTKALYPGFFTSHNKFLAVIPYTSQGKAIPLGLCLGKGFCTTMAYSLWWNRAKNGISLRVKLETSLARQTLYRLDWQRVSNCKGSSPRDKNDLRRENNPGSSLTNSS